MNSQENTRRDSVESTALFGISDTSKRLRQMSIRSAVAFPGKSGKTNYSDEWYTPPRIVSALGPFDLDPSAGPMNHAARNIRHPEECGLSVEWSGRVWLNPPYSNVHEWLAKFVAHGDGITLVNARPETQWFQRLVANAAAVHWLRAASSSTCRKARQSTRPWEACSWPTAKGTPPRCSPLDSPAW